MPKLEEQVYKRSWVVLFFKKILVGFHFILPKSWYRVFYNFTFQTYKTIVRLTYFRFYLYYKIKGDERGAEKIKTIYKIMPYSLVGSKGLSQTYDLATKIIKDNLRGDFVECGVAQGGCSALMALVAFENDGNGRKVWLFDSFEGLPKPTGKDFSKKKKSLGNFIRPLTEGSCLGTYEEVQKLLFSKLKINKENVKMIKGWFQDTLSHYKDKINEISLLRIDADWYESTKCCLENLYGNVINGGFVIIDDYGTCFGAKKALDEFLAERRISAKLIHDGRGGCYFQKVY